MNGGGPPTISDEDYSVICDGDVVVSGQYLGCVLVDATYYWLSVYKGWWKINEGSPGSGFYKMTTSVWDRTSSSGTYTWNAEELLWEDEENEKCYRWDEGRNDEVALTEVEC